MTLADASAWAASVGLRVVDRRDFRYVVNSEGGMVGRGDTWEQAVERAKGVLALAGTEEEEERKKAAKPVQRSLFG